MALDSCLYIFLEKKQANRQKQGWWVFGVIHTEEVGAKAEGREMESLRKECGSVKRACECSDSSWLTDWSSMKKGKSSSYQLRSKQPSKQGR